MPIGSPLLLEAQPYIDAVVPVSYVAMVSAGQHIDYDLQKAEEGPNGVTHIAERYARFFDLDYDGVPWLEVEEEKMARVVWHIPMRRSVRSEDDWRDIMNRIPATQIIFGQEPLHGIDDWDMLRIAQVIKGASVFAGTVSFCNCIAEAVGTPNLVEQAPDCHNIRPTVSLNGKSNDAVVKLIKDRVWTH